MTVASDGSLVWRLGSRCLLFPKSELSMGWGALVNLAELSQLRMSFIYKWLLN